MGEGDHHPSRKEPLELEVEEVPSLDPELELTLVQLTEVVEEEVASFLLEEGEEVEAASLQ